MAKIEHQVLGEPDSVNEVNNQAETYRIRYIELAKAIAGLFLGSICFILACTTSLTGSPLLVVGATIANLIALLISEHIIHRLCIYFNLYTETKSKNPLYRNFKTLASLGSSVGAILAMMIPFCTDTKLNVSIYSASAGFMLGLFAFIFRYYRQSMPAVSEDRKNLNARAGTEGWSKYTKLAFTFGTSIGQSVGGYLSYVGGYDAITSWNTITFYGAIAAIASFFSVAILVPVINYFTRNETKKGALVFEDKDIFNSNYVRTGMTLGVAIGTILGNFLGPALFVGLSVSVSVAVATGIFSIICGLTLGVYGHKLSLYLQNNWGVSVNTDNSWSYASRNTSYVFGFIGTAIACLLCPGAALLQSAAIGSAISGFIGWFVGIGVVCKARQVEPNEKKSTVPWTQRISTGATKGSIIGAFSGLVLALTLCSGGSLGLIGWITLSSALGGIWGSVIEGVEDPVAKKLMRKTFLGHKNIPIMAVKSGNAPSLHLNLHSINSIQDQDSSNDDSSLYSSNSNLLFFSSNTAPIEQEMLETHVNVPTENFVENRCFY